MSTEKRWLAVSEDGRHTTLGRHRDPTPDEIREVGAALDRVAAAGWLVVSEGVYHSREPVTLLMVRPISARQADWPEAERRWHVIRAEAVKDG